jgi:hypothetical protein
MKKTLLICMMTLAFSAMALAQEEAPAPVAPGSETAAPADAGAAHGKKDKKAAKKAKKAKGNKKSH